MNRPPNPTQTVAVGVAGALLMALGLGLSEFSNPRRFTLAPAADRVIDLLALGGVLCTLAGLGAVPVGGPCDDEVHAAGHAT